jgi:hypothetical protein
MLCVVIVGCNKDTLDVDVFDDNVIGFQIQANNSSAFLFRIIFYNAILADTPFRSISERGVFFSVGKKEKGYRENIFSQLGKNISSIG